MPIAGPLAAVLSTMAKVVEDGTVKGPKPKNTPRGRFISVDALEQLVKDWRARAGGEEWGLGHAFDECADALEQLMKRPEGRRDVKKRDEGSQP